MKKKVIILSFFAVMLSNFDVISNNRYPILSVTTASSQEKFIETVEAQDIYGDKTIYLNVYETVTANGKSNFYVKYKGQRYEIDYIENNKYKPFTVKIENERWYFASKTLDLYFVTRGQQKRI